MSVDSLSRQFFFAVGKPHRPMNAELPGEATGHLPIASVFRSIDSGGD